MLHVDSSSPGIVNSQIRIQTEVESTKNLEHWSNDYQKQLQNLKEEEIKFLFEETIEVISMAFAILNAGFNLWNECSKSGDSATPILQVDIELVLLPLHIALTFKI